MAYCTQADIKNAKRDARLDQLAPDGAGGIDADKITAGIAAADDIIDGYLDFGGVTMPSPTPGIIKQCSIGLTICWLYSRTEHVPEHETIECDRWHKILDKIAQGQYTFDSTGVTASVVVEDIFDEDQFDEDSLDWPT